MKNQIYVFIHFIIDLISEITRREKHTGVFPEAEVDLFMKVISNVDKKKNFNNIEK